MKKTSTNILLLVLIYSNIFTANGKPKYTYFCEGETVILMCMGDADANTVSWIGPAHNNSKPSPAIVVDLYGKNKTWNTILYTSGGLINPIIKNFGNITIVDTRGSGDFDLQISNASISDEGFYRCDIYTNTQKPLTTKEYILLLKSSFQEITLDTFIFNSKELPSNLTIDNETDEDTIIGIEDKILEIACNVESGSAPENISWILNGTVLYTGGPKRIIYKFLANRTDHNSKLTCEVTSNLTDAPLRKTVHLNIKYRPKVMILHDKKVPILEGANTTLCCDIDSNPSRSFIYWLKDGKGIKSKMNSSCVFFNPLDRQDRGSYKCFAGNEIGNGSIETYLTVYYPPTIYLDYHNYSINESMNAVQCKADGEPNNIIFFRLEHLSDFNEHIRYIEVSSDGIAKLPFTTESERYQDTGFYQCNASNGVPDSKGNFFQYNKAYLVSAAQPVFVPDNKKIQYGEIGKPMNIIVNIYSTSEIKCLHLNAIGSLNITELLKKSVPVTMNFHGVNITANGIEITFRVVKLMSFQWFNITVCNNFAMNSFILEVRNFAKYSSKEKSISSEGIGIVVLLILIVVLLVFIGNYVRYLKQRHRKGRTTVPTDQTTERNSDESAHYIEIVDDNNVRAIFHEQNNQMVLADSRLVVENRNLSFVPEELNLALSNNDSDTSEHTIASSDNEIDALDHLDNEYERPYTTLVSHNYAEDEHGYSSTTKRSNNDSDTSEHTIASSDNEIDALDHLDNEYERPYTTLVSHNYAEDEHGYSSTTKRSNNDSDTSEHTIASSDNEIDAFDHLDNEYERPYTTLVSHNYAEDEHGYSSTTKSSTNDTSTTLHNANSRPCTVFTEPDKQKIFIFTDDSQQSTKRNTGEYINLIL